MFGGRENGSGEDEVTGRRPTRREWSLVVPVKPLEVAKSRLVSLGPHRERLALAIAADTVTAALRCPRVDTLFVVTNDPVAGKVLAGLGAVVMGDEPDAGLNPALRHGQQSALTANPDTGVAAVSADLPALRPGELARVLDAGSQHELAFVPDAAGAGTTVLAAAPGAPFSPHFGPGSRDRHAAQGAVELTIDDIASVRRDVDTPADLGDAVRLGAGPRTTGIVTSLPAHLLSRG